MRNRLCHSRNAIPGWSLGLLGAVFGWGLALLLIGTALAAEGQAALENKVKAAFLYNFWGCLESTDTGNQR